MPTILQIPPLDPLRSPANMRALDKLRAVSTGVTNLRVEALVSMPRPTTSDQYAADNSGLIAPSRNLA